MGDFNKIGSEYWKFFCLTKGKNRGIIIKLTDEGATLKSLKSAQLREK